MRKTAQFLTISYKIAQKSCVFRESAILLSINGYRDEVAHLQARNAPAMVTIHPGPIKGRMKKQTQFSSAL